MPNVDSVYVDLAIGFAVAFFILSLVPSGINEGIAFVTRIRSKFLWAYLNQLFTARDAAAPKRSAAREATRAVAAGTAPGTVAQSSGKAEALGLPGSALHTLRLMFWARGRDPRPAGGDAPTFVDQLLRQLRPIDIGGPTGRTSVKYIPATSFTQAVLDVARQPASAEADAPVAEGQAEGVSETPELVATVEEQVDEWIAGLEGTPVHGTVRSLWETAQRDLARFRTGLEQWFDAEMSRLSGLYKRATRWILALSAITVAFAANVDPVALGRDLWRDPDRRASLVELATATGAGADADTDPELENLFDQCRHGNETPEVETVEQAAEQVTDVRNCVVDALGRQQQLGLLTNSVFDRDRFGDAWSGDDGGPFRALRLGLVAGALYLGAPFWFDVVRRLAGRKRSATGAET
jgi:hypothetical protein